MQPISCWRANICLEQPMTHRGLEADPMLGRQWTCPDRMTVKLGGKELIALPEKCKS